MLHALLVNTLFVVNTPLKTRHGSHARPVGSHFMMQLPSEGRALKPADMEISNYPCGSRVLTICRMASQGIMMAIVHKAKPTPTRLTGVSFSRNTSAPTNVPSTITPMFMTEKISAGLPGSTWCARI